MDCKCSIDHMQAKAPWTCACKCHDEPIEPTPLDTDQLVDAMAESAHNAWWATYVSLGYDSRRSAWGEEFMVPFSALSERGKEFDRMIMRAILQRFADVGAKVVY
jgi:hypothetical protein